MNLSEALQFLHDHQPMPHDPDEALFRRYKAVTAYFFQNPDAACVPLLLGSFADWDDWSVYDSVQSVIRIFPAEDVLPHLCSFLASPVPAVRLWTADTARYFPHPILVDLLGNLLRDHVTEIRLAAATALEAIVLPQVARLAAEMLDVEEDEEVLDILRSIVGRSSSG